MGSHSEDHADLVDEFDRPAALESVSACRQLLDQLDQLTCLRLADVVAVVDLVIVEFGHETKPLWTLSMLSGAIRLECLSVYLNKDGNICRARASIRPAILEEHGSL